MSELAELLVQCDAVDAVDAAAVRAAGELARREAEHLARRDPSRLSRLKATLDVGRRWHAGFEPWACWAEGTGEFLRGRPGSAAPLLERAAKLFRRAEDQHTAARVDIALIDALVCLGFHRRAKERGRRALATFVNLGDKQRQASILINLGGVADSRDQVKRAAKLWREAKGLLDQNDAFRHATIDANLAVAELGLGRFRSAVKLYQRAADSFHGLGATGTAATATLGVAETRAMLGELGEALVMAREAEKVATELEDDNLLFETRLLMARLELELGHHERVRNVVRRTVPRCRAAGRRDDIARFAVLDALAIAAGADGDLEIAVAEAESELQRAGLKVAAAAMRAELARSGWPMELARLRRDTSTLDRAGLPVQADLARLALVASLAAAGQQRGAMDVCRQVLARKRAAVWLRIEGHVAMAELLREEAPAQAVRHLRSAIRIGESLRGRLGCDVDRSALMSRLSAAYELLVELLLERGDALSKRQAFDLVARVKSRALLEAIDRRRDLKWQANPEMVRRWNVLRRELAAMLAALETRHEQHTRYSRSLVEGRVQVLARHLEELELELARADPQLASLLGRRSGPPLRPLLRQGEALVEVFFCASDLVLFDLRRGGLRVTVLPGVRGQIESWTKALRFQLSKAAYGRSHLERPGKVLVEQTRRRLAAIGEVLLGPVLKRGVPELLMVAPHGPLHHVPLAALEIAGEAIIAACPLAVVPSARVAARILERRSIAPAKLGVGGAAPANLPEIRGELEAIAGRFPAAELVEQARIADVQHLLESCEAVHLASHGAFQPFFPAGSGIRLADGWLTALDLVQLRLKARFVSIGSCASGQVAVTAGEELMGVVRALFEGGTDAALLAPGALDDRIARQTAQQFYDQILELGPGESLRQTLLALRHEHPHPALWAAFQLYGNPRAWERAS